MTDGQYVTAYELSAQAQFDVPLIRTEATGDLQGRLIVCATNNGKTVSGYGNGCRNFDGSAV